MTPWVSKSLESGRIRRWEAEATKMPATPKARHHRTRSRALRSWLRAMARVLRIGGAR